MVDPIIENMDDAGMIGRPDLWPSNPYLHVKKTFIKGHRPYCGIIYRPDIESGVFIILHHSDGVKYHYDSIQEIVDAGWIVD